MTHFSKGTLVAFRDQPIEHDMDRQLIERTVQVAEQTKEMGSWQVRGVLDSSPLWGAGRVEDPYNLIGHALHRVLGILARQQGRELAAVAGEAGADLLADPRLKAALDADWDDRLQRQGALQQVVRLLETVETFVQGLAADHGCLASAEFAMVAHQKDLHHPLASDKRLALEQVSRSPTAGTRSPARDTVGPAVVLRGQNTRLDAER